MRQMHWSEVQAATTAFGVVLEAHLTHLSQILSCELPALPHHAIHFIHVAGGQVSQITFANSDVIRGAVGMQFLMPLLDEFALDAWSVALLDAMGAHDVQDTVTNGIATSRAAARHSFHSQAKHRPDAWVAGVGHCGAHDATNAFLGMCHILGLIPGLSIPFQGFCICQAQHRGDPGGRLEVHPSGQGIITLADPLKLGEVLVARFSLTEALRQALLAGRLRGGHLVVRGQDRNPEVVTSLALQP
mmetsp:Transcript_81532/g.166075  ORF Transcript_81532/g.166075 Transcript_81532/m.166075 type:complete len:245 (-) Transcript_81532:230-964(-)